jgi:hypothetical protein
MTEYFFSRACHTYYIKKEVKFGTDTEMTQDNIMSTQYQYEDQPTFLDNDLQSWNSTWRWSPTPESFESLQPPSSRGRRWSNTAYMTKGKHHCCPTSNWTPGDLRMRRDGLEEQNLPNKPTNSPPTLTTTNHSSTHLSINHHRRPSRPNSTEGILGNSSTIAPHRCPPRPSTFLQLPAPHRRPPWPNASSPIQPVIVKCQATHLREDDDAAVRPHPLPWRPPLVHAASHHGGRRHASYPRPRGLLTSLHLDCLPSEKAPLMHIAPPVHPQGILHICSVSTLNGHHGNRIL